MAQKILVLATSFLDNLITHPPDEGRAKRMLEELSQNSGGDIEIVYHCKKNPLEQLKPEEFKEVVAVIADLEKYDREFLSKVGVKAAGSLGLIARYGIGYSSVDITAATHYGIMVTNCPGCNALPTAEWAHSTILDISGKRILHHKRAAAGKAKEGPSRLDISERIFGIIGTGTIGKLVNRLLKGYNMTVIVYDPFPDEGWARQNDVEYVELKELCRRADIITLHAACSKTIIGEKEIKLMKPTTILVNCARGILVDYKAAYVAVKEGRIWGYGVDETWTDQKIPIDGLNIIVSPHVGSDTDRGKIGMQIMSAQAIVDFMNGNIPKYVVNKEVLKEKENGL